MNVIDIATCGRHEPCGRCSCRPGTVAITDRGTRIALLCDGCVVYVERRCRRMAQIARLLIARGVDVRMAHHRAARWAC